VQAACAEIVHAARANNKSIAAACAQPDIEFWLGLDIDLLFCTNDIACLKKAAGDTLANARDLLAKRPSRPAAKHVA
jgi:hypothetical protein